MYMTKYNDTIKEILQNTTTLVLDLEHNLIYLHEHIELLDPDEFDAILPELEALTQMRDKLYALLDTYYPRS